MGLNKANDANAGPEHLSDALDRLRPAEIAAEFAASEFASKNFTLAASRGPEFIL